MTGVHKWEDVRDQAREYWRQVKALAKPLFDQGADKVYVAKCCERIYVGTDPATGCSTCDKKPESREFTREEYEYGQQAPADRT